MADASRLGGSIAAAGPLPVGPEGTGDRAAAQLPPEPQPSMAPRVGWGFICLYTLAFISTSLLFLAPLLVTLALKVNSLVGLDAAPNGLALVAGVGGLL